ncbi:hypothetical protein DWV84_12775 [Blautia sp. AF13-16]|nr:hypothetical protein C3R19_25580 [Blautia producta]RHP81333.1 hypothetical protein DXA40_09895 [Blautia sp. OF01-4LB]RHS15269.1 hypothetical protein DWV84_12775 [Blautia sp. AF13-16]
MPVLYITRCFHSADMKKQGSQPWYEAECTISVLRKSYYLARNVLGTGEDERKEKRRFLYGRL